MGTETELAVAATQVTAVTSPSGFTTNRGIVQGEPIFPAGLRVLVVDDDPICLLILDRMLRSCLYKVTTCGRAIEALKILREKKDGFDVVISDVHMPDMDGFKLLELVGLEMDLPVIMMSANGETSAVMKGIKHGACDYLLKPVRIEELKNIWQHVVRKKRKDPELLGNIEDRLRFDDCGEPLTSASEGPDGASKHSKKRKDAKEEEEDTELENDDPSTSKKPRVVWSVDLHQKFVNAVNQLGIDKAVPKRILELMDVRGLTRENVASHLQKYRLYLKRISGVAHQAGGLGSAFPGAPDAAFGAVGGGLLGDGRAQMSPQALVSTLQAGLLGRLGPNNNTGMASLNPSLLQQIAAIHDVNSAELVGPFYGSPLMGTSGSPHLTNASGLDLEHPSQGSRLSALQQLSVATGLGRVGQLAGLDNFQADTSSHSRMMQILQQQPNSQMAGRTANEFPDGKWVTGGLQMPSGDIAARLSSVNSFSTGIGFGAGSHLMSGQESSLNGPSLTASDGVSSLRRTVAVDIKNLNLSQPGNVNNSLPSTVSSPSTSYGSDSVTIATGKRGFVSNALEVLPLNVQRAVSNSVAFSAGNSASRLNMGLSNWQGWQSLGPSQELGHPTSVLAAHYNQISAGQASKVDSAREQGSLWASGFQDSVVDAGRVKPLVPTAPSYREQCTGESEHRFKEGPFELLLGPKAENGAIPEPFSSSDDLLNAYFKQQQQELMGFNDGDLATEGYSLGNMYVK